MDSILFLGLQLEEGDCLRIQSVTKQKQMKKKKKHVSENDLVIAPKHETLIFNFNLPKAWYSLISCSWKSVSLSQ